MQSLETTRMFESRALLFFLSSSPKWHRQNRLCGKFFFLCLFYRSFEVHLILDLFSSSFAARFLLKYYVVVQPKEQCEKLFADQMSLIRRVVFSRSLRLLPLAEQVGAVEALAFIVKEAKSVLPLSDQHLLAFLSELLKMSSVADGEMADSALTGSVVDKNGIALTGSKTSSSSSPPEKYPSHASAIFFRRECILVFFKGVKFVIPEELPHGIQLRVSSISLLHSVISGHPNTFFDAEVSTPIGTGKKVVSKAF